MEICVPASFHITMPAILSTSHRWSEADMGKAIAKPVSVSVTFVELINEIEL